MYLCIWAVAINGKMDHCLFPSCFLFIVVFAICSHLMSFGDLMAFFDPVPGCNHSVGYSLLDVTKQPLFVYQCFPLPTQKEWWTNAYLIPGLENYSWPEERGDWYVLINLFCLNDRTCGYPMIGLAGDSRTNLEKKRFNQEFIGGTYCCAAWWQPLAYVVLKGKWSVHSPSMMNRWNI